MANTALARLYAENIADMPRFIEARHRLDAAIALEGPGPRRDKLLKCAVLLEGARADWEEMQDCLKAVIHV